MSYTYYRRYNPAPKRSSFKSFFWLVLILVVLALVLRACVSVAGSFLKDKEDEATLTVNQGSAQVTEWGETLPQPASDAQLFLVGDTVETAEDTVVTLTFSNGTSVVLDEKSKFIFADAGTEGAANVLKVDLVEGRAFVTQTPDDESELRLELHTDVMNISSLSATYLTSNQANQEYIYGFEGQADVNFVDRSQDDSVIDTITLTKGKKSVLSDTDEKNLLARQSVTLLGDAGDDLMGDTFVAFNLGEPVQLVPSEGSEDATAEGDAAEGATGGNAATTETPATGDAETPTDDSATTPAPSGLQIKVTSPGLTSTIQKSAIAIEGSIVSGTASTVTVTWDGNNVPYTLGGFAPGDTTFRYVADASYGNFKAGANTFTVVAKATDGTVSNTVTVVITGEF